MSPFQGHPDWQRSELTDSGTLFAETGTGHTAAMSTPLLATGNWRNLTLDHTCLTATYLTVTFVWYADQGQTVEVGRRSYAIDGASPLNVFVGKIANLGPFCKITVQAAGGGNFTHSLYVAADNRFTPIEIFPASALLTSVTAVPIAAGATVFANFTSLFSGPALLFVNCPSATSLAGIQAETAANVWTRISRHQADTPGHVLQLVVIPPVPCRVEVTSTAAGASVFDATVTPSLTGAT